MNLLTAHRPAASGAASAAPIAPAGPGAVPADAAAARARCAARAEPAEPPAERGWFESSRELLAGLTVIELGEAPARRAGRLQ
jgi:hypothetical protein